MEFENEQVKEKTCSGDLAGQQLREEVAVLLPVAVRADKHYLARKEYIDPAGWSENLSEEEHDKVRYLVWMSGVEREVEQLKAELYYDISTSHSADFLKCLEEHAKRSISVLEEWRRRYPTYRLIGDYVYSIQPRLAQWKVGAELDGHDFVVRRLRLVDFITFMVANRELFQPRAKWSGCMLNMVVVASILTIAGILMR